MVVVMTENLVKSLRNCVAGEKFRRAAFRVAPPRERFLIGLDRAFVNIRFEILWKLRYRFVPLKYAFALQLLSSDCLKIIDPFILRAFIYFSKQECLILSKK